MFFDLEVLMIYGACFIIFAGFLTFCWKKSKADRLSSRKNFVMRLFGYILFFGGMVALVLCGGCTLVFLGIEVFESITMSGPPAVDYINPYSILFFGGIPTVGGLIAFFTGRWLKNKGIRDE